MICQALQHLPGIGPERLARLQEQGIATWDDLLAAGTGCLRVGTRRWLQLETAIEQCRKALKNDDIGFLVNTLRTVDHWRLLARYGTRTTFFDIETDGLDCTSTVTVVACYHRGTLHHFVQGENLDAFLTLLDDVELLASFNGNSFDVPRIVRHFNVPELPCPHIDLRWLCYHDGLAGGLKNIEQRLGVNRPPELHGVDGADAVQLWRMWCAGRDPAARDFLVRYCCADALALVHVAEALITRRTGVPVLLTDGPLWPLLHRNDRNQSMDAGEPPRTRTADTLQNGSLPPPRPGPANPEISRLRRRLKQHLQKKR